MTDDRRHAIGIDLGTTNCALAHAELTDEMPPPIPLPIPQIVHPGEVSARELLPSFLYLPAQAEIAQGAFELPWHATDASDDAHVVGTWARAQGATTPARLVSSAKSWLSHSGADRRGNILPWGAPDEIPRISPLEASARYLAHLRAAWETAHPDAPLAAQDVVLTVPASFDAVARELTVEAAKRAGFEESLRLLEEPQAALYDWVAQRGAAWREDVSVGDVILVVDIGGGTTDFSLIAVRQEEGSLALDRVAVGDHILLGGDNMDLALAYTVRARLEEEGKRLDDWQMLALTHGCRAAKESLLGDDPPPTHPLVIPGRSSKLIGGTIRTEVSRDEIAQLLLDGFFPIVPADARPQVPRRAGLTSLGLPYASDAGVTRHLAAFLGRASLDESSPSSQAGAFVRPTAILFNGGVTRSPKVRERIHAVIASWVEGAGGETPRVLAGTDADLAVSRGAAYYAQARRHGGVRIRGGTAQAYYVGVERAGLAVPGIPPQLDALCVAPFGMEEGTQVELDQPFGLIVGEPVSFRFFGSSTRRTDDVGSVANPAELSELAPIETTFETTGEDVPGHVVQVRLVGRVTEVGTLELAAVEEGTDRRWKLSFNVRLE
jgi:molecular chaperone DnaK (HSP70)